MQAQKVETFIIQVMNGEPLAIIRLALFIAIAYFVYNLLRRLYWRGRPFFKVMFYVIGGLLVYGILFCPDVVGDGFDRLAQWASEKWFYSEEEPSRVNYY